MSITRMRPLGWLALVVAALGIWLFGVGMSRQAAPRPAARATATPVAPPLDEDLARGDAAFDQGDIAAALAAYTRAVERNPAFAEARNNRAYLYMTQQDYARALDDLDRALQSRPDYVNALMNRGDIYNYYYQVDHTRAAADYNRVLQLDPAHPLARGHHAMANLYGGDWAGFLADLSRSVSTALERESPSD